MNEKKVLLRRGIATAIAVGISLVARSAIAVLPDVPPRETQKLPQPRAVKPPAPKVPSKQATPAPDVPSTQPSTAPATALANDLKRLNPGNVFKDCDACPEMVVIPTGNFVMGSPASEQGRDSDEGPPRTVTISRPFAVGKYEVTYAEWEACVRDGGCSYNPDDRGWGRSRRPVVNVSWEDAKQYIRWLSRKTGRNYRLLSEAEWEYVARARTTTVFSTGPSINPNQANYDSNSSYGGNATGQYRRQTVPVGSFEPNAFGVYDMHGNVWEWVEDCYNSVVSAAPNDGSAWTSGGCNQRVLRGGSWANVPWHVRSAIRNGNVASYRSDSYGLRVSKTD